MFKNPFTFIEVMVLLVVLFCVCIPGSLWAWDSVKAGKMVDYPANLAGYMAGATAMVVGILGVQAFTQAKAPEASTTTTKTTVP